MINFYNKFKRLNFIYGLISGIFIGLSLHVMFNLSINFSILLIIITFVVNMVIPFISGIYDIKTKIQEGIDKKIEEELEQYKNKISIKCHKSWSGYNIYVESISNIDFKSIHINGYSEIFINKYPDTITNIRNFIIKEEDFNKIKQDFITLVFYYDEYGHNYTIKHKLDISKINRTAAMPLFY